MTIFVIETDPEWTKLHFEFEKVISFSKVKKIACDYYLSLTQGSQSHSFESVKFIEKSDPSRIYQ